MPCSYNDVDFLLAPFKPGLATLFLERLLSWFSFWLHKFCFLQFVFFFAFWSPMWMPCMTIQRTTPREWIREDSEGILFAQMGRCFEARPNAPRETGPWIIEKCQVGQVFSSVYNNIYFIKEAGNNSANGYMNIVTRFLLCCCSFAVLAILTVSSQQPPYL